MAGKLQLSVVTPERTVVEAEVDSVQLPGELGYLGILPGHAPLITLLKPGVISWSPGGGEGAAAISGGFAEVAEDRVTVLADTAEKTAEVDVASAEKDRSQASEQLRTANAEEVVDAARNRVEVAEARLSVAKRG
ncbi:MAG TPA: ATP synthase F1 subunit epsilon [Thermoanaerobaculia bacterium]|jgi:F-type H+-transporting ATPase subunit epsilon